MSPATAKCLRSWCATTRNTPPPGAGASRPGPQTIPRSRWSPTLSGNVSAFTPRRSPSPAPAGTNTFTRPTFPERTRERAFVESGRQPLLLQRREPAPSGAARSVVAGGRQRLLLQPREPAPSSVAISDRHPLQPPQRPWQAIDQILGDEAGPEVLGGVAMEPAGGSGGAERIQTLREKPGHEAGEDVAAAAGREIGRRVGIDGCAPIRRGDDAVAAFEEHHGATLGRRGAGAGELVALEPKDPGELAFMGGHDCRALDGGEERRRRGGEGREGAGIEDDGALRRKRRQHPCPRRLIRAEAGSQQQRVAPDIAEECCEILRP